MNPRGENGPRVVPVYAITGGRTRSRGPDLEFETLVTTTEHGIASRGRRSSRPASSTCRAPVSVVEVAARLQVPIGVARVLVSDLHADGMLTIHGSARYDGRPRTEVLERLLNGLRTR